MPSLSRSVQEKMQEKVKSDLLHSLAAGETHFRGRLEELTARVEELESLSGMPSDGWLDPQVRQRLLDRVDEGFIQRPGFGPGRQVRYHFIDETLWLHPASNTRVISTSPRQEVMIIDLDLY